MSSPRLLLIVAPQNMAMGHLSALEDSAHALREVLQRDDLGHCSPAPSDGMALPYEADAT